jgi:iron complex transport system substrate-binding protein
VKIVSLVPSATEVLFALGLGDEVIAVTHECDWPPPARDKLHVTRSVIDPGLTTGEIDAAVRERTAAGLPIYELDESVLHRVQPNLIVAQQLCDVCAVSFDDVREIAKRIDSEPAVISLDPSTLGEVLETVRSVGRVTRREEDAERVLGEAAERIDRVQAAVDGAPRPRVAALEWLDPVFVAGHWTPQLIDLAGGEDVLGMAGEPSAKSTWDEVAAAQPEIVVVMPCGYGAPRAVEEAEAHRDQLAALGAERVIAVDGSAYYSRPGPRLVDGLELMAHILHPDRVPDAPSAPVKVL